MTSLLAPPTERLDPPASALKVAEDPDRDVPAAFRAAFADPPPARAAASMAGRLWDEWRSCC